MSFLVSLRALILISEVCRTSLSCHDLHQVSCCKFSPPVHFNASWRQSTGSLNNLTVGKRAWEEATVVSTESGPKVLTRLAGDVGPMKY
eukprot:COSAG02_NODE_164_length_32230_cov_37.505587_21_plen_89_part_00